MDRPAQVFACRQDNSPAANARGRVYCSIDGLRVKCFAIPDSPELPYIQKHGGGMPDTRIADLHQHRCEECYLER